MESIILFLLPAFIIQVDSVPLPQASHDSLQFLVLADWGGWNFPPYTTPVQTDVANQMATIADRRNISFVVSLGDNFYKNGVIKRSRNRFQTTFEQVYHQESLQIPWYIIAGNHDHFGSVILQIKYSKISHRWMFPNHYYKQSWMLPGGKVLDLFLLDTYILCGAENRPKNMNSATLQWSWIERSLKDSTADFLLVGGHYPVYSVGKHGSTECLYSTLEPLLYKYHVTAYLSGHDHSLQHIQMKRIEQKIDFFVIGAGAWSDDCKTHLHAVQKGSLEFFYRTNNVGGFSLIDVTAERMTISFITSNGDTVYNYNLYPRK